MVDWFSTLDSFRPDTDTLDDELAVSPDPDLLAFDELTVSDAAA